MTNLEWLKSEVARLERELERQKQRAERNEEAARKLKRLQTQAPHRWEVGGRYFRGLPQAQTYVTLTGLGFAKITPVYLGPKDDQS